MCFQVIQIIYKFIKMYDVAFSFENTNINFATFVMEKYCI